MITTPRFSVCVPVLDRWVEMSSHRSETLGRKALTEQLMTDPDAALWDWATNTIIEGGTE